MTRLATTRPSAARTERARRAQLAVSIEQRRELKRLAVIAGVEMPRVYSMAEASDEINRLKGYQAQPVLSGFSASTGGQR